ncbi:NADP-dependent oxidoreductase domain-containing protein [Caenorhabditis elegans]|uniref:NADP-dependent oxidoreductase domain-containing protein n=1 Tax=Caenorhabditis elegans TaxID=6239 RepID=P91021_CAEEL|nr:NADP-dependent oxidoreductase domain-containing protein [Caenorhabditis elegans]CCD63507.1 NADP-dependent oxidoreductase domain-containing protein [Caenorhabditis elegans]|eukprot:NP_509243.1 Uncharacterized protein CELE_C07D8.5 [Caenorhabditis elegans]
MHQAGNINDQAGRSSNSDGNASDDGHPPALTPILLKSYLKNSDAKSHLTLSNAHSMPAVGLGTWQSNAEDVISAVKAAVKNGYSLIDTASGYNNEEFIGTAIKEVIAEGVVKREDLFITTKVPNLFSSLRLVSL